MYRPAHSDDTRMDIVNTRNTLSGWTVMNREFPPVSWLVRSAADRAADDWYDSIGLALQILGKHWDDDLTEDEDAFVLAFADEISPRPESERDD